MAIIPLNFENSDMDYLLQYTKARNQMWTLCLLWHIVYSEHHHKKCIKGKKNLIKGTFVVLYVWLRKYVTYVRNKYLDIITYLATLNFNTVKRFIVFMLHFTKQIPNYAKI